MEQSSLKSNVALIECKICGGAASYSYFGVISCESCKMFFKRNCQKRQIILKCSFNNHCEVNMNSRRVCSSCRLEKCFTKGMKIEMIRSCQTKTNRNIRKEKSKRIAINLNESNEHKQFSTFNILQSDQSKLTIDQWNLLSNLVQCYDEYNEILLAQYFLCEQTALPLKLRFKYSAVREFLTSLLTKTRLLFEKNSHFLSLCSHDRSNMLHISTIYITIFSALFIVRQSRLLDQSGFLQSIDEFFGSTMIDNIKRLIGQLDFDLTFIKLIFSILSLSTTNYTIYKNIDANNLGDMKTIIQTHDKYIELAWKYLSNKYDYCHTVTCFSRLVNCLFTLNNILIELYKEKFFTDIIDCVIEQTKQTLVNLN